MEDSRTKVVVETSNLASSCLRNWEENLPKHDMNELKKFALRPMHMHLAMNCQHLAVVRYKS